MNSGLNSKTAFHTRVTNRNSRDNRNELSALQNGIQVISVLF